jgi:uncharacterized membrane protein
MLEGIVDILLWFCIVGCGVIGGLFFAFSTFIMTALERVGQVHGILAMNSINVVILRSVFMPVFLGTTLASLALGVMALFQWAQPGSAAMLGGALIYVLGMFVCTMILNVPLNNALAAVTPAGAEAIGVWARYLKEWTLWNHVRTFCSIAAVILFLVALLARAKS